MEIGAEDLIIGLWALTFPGGDWLLIVVRKAELQGRVLLTWRFRYDKDDDVWLSNDERHWYHGLPRQDMTEEQAIQCGDGMQQQLISKCKFTSPDRILVHGGMDELLALLKQGHHPLFHFLEAKGAPPSSN